MRWVKVLLSIDIVPCPGLSAVLTGQGPAMSPAGSYSPLVVIRLTETGSGCQ